MYTPAEKNYNWENKVDRAQQAAAHTTLMEMKYGRRIYDCAKNTRIYSGYVIDSLATNAVTELFVEDTDTVSAIFEATARYPGEKIAAVNFASFKHPGGMFLNGSRAQEECLCHESFLFNVLRQKQNFYEYNRNHLNNSLYISRVLYSPDVLFIRDKKEATADIITCAAPNFTSAKRNGVSGKINHDTLKNRIDFILRITNIERVDTLVFGAFGCGVFGQDAEQVASILKTLLETTNKNLKHIICAVPASASNDNLAKFQKVLGSHNIF